MDYDALRGPLAKVVARRREQHETWGVQRHDLPVWLTIIAEEVGELSRATLSLRFTLANGGKTAVMDMDAIADEAADVAASCLALMEHIDEGREALIANRASPDAEILEHVGIEGSTDGP